MVCININNSLKENRARLPRVRRIVYRENWVQKSRINVNT